MSTTRAPQPVSNTQKALTYGLGALAIGGAARHTYKNLKHKQQAAQQATRRAERDYRVARARALRDLSHAQQALSLIHIRRSRLRG